MSTDAHDAGTIPIRRPPSGGGSRATEGVKESGNPILLREAGGGWWKPVGGNYVIAFGKRLPADVAAFAGPEARSPVLSSSRPIWRLPVVSRRLSHVPLSLSLPSLAFEWFHGDGRYAERQTPPLAEATREQEVFASSFMGVLPTEE